MYTSYAGAATMFLYINRFTIGTPVIRLKHEKSMDVDELTVVTCNQNNQYDHVTWYE